MLLGSLVAASGLQFLRLVAAATPASPTALSTPIAPAPPTTAQGVPCVAFQGDVVSCGNNCTRHILNDTITTHGAGCLDGSAPGFYFRPGRGTGAQKFLLWSHGGGWCRTEGECAGRALTYEGSSRCNPEPGPPRANMNKGIMSSTCSENPRFCNHTVVYFMYCDGGSWTGDRSDPVPTSQAEYADPLVPAVHLKGRRNLAAILDTLLTPEYGLAAATEVLYAGASAGGLTAYLHCDNVRERLPDSASVHCLGDAGFFIDHQSVNGRAVYRESMTYAFRMHNASASVNEECVATKTEDLAWMCMFADYTLPHIRTPFFMSNSNYDSWSMGSILGAQGYYTLSPTEVNEYSRCTTTYASCSWKWKAAVDGWGQAFRRKMHPVVAAPQHGYFVNNCHRHHNIDGAEAFSTKINGTSLVAAVGKWMDGQHEGMKLLDDIRPGSNPTC